MYIVVIDMRTVCDMDKSRNMRDNNIGLAVLYTNSVWYGYIKECAVW